jgi:hypothetical protein
MFDFALPPMLETDPNGYPLEAGYSFFDSNDVELVGRTRTRRSKYFNVGAYAYLSIRSSVEGKLIGKSIPMVEY